MTEPDEDAEQAEHETPISPGSGLPRRLRDSWAHRPLALEYARISEWYARFYAPLAVVSAVIAVMPIFNTPVTVDGHTVLIDRYGNLFDMASRSGGDPAVLGLLLLAAMLVLLIVACVRVRSRAVPIGLVVLAGLLIVMLVTRPGTGSPRPELSGAGDAGLVLGIWIMVLAAVHTVHLSRATGSR
jgi:hypothetical protein